MCMLWCVGNSQISTRVVQTAAEHPSSSRTDTDGTALSLVLQNEVCILRHPSSDYIRLAAVARTNAIARSGIVTAGKIGKA